MKFFLRTILLLCVFIFCFSSCRRSNPNARRENPSKTKENNSGREASKDSLEISLLEWSQDQLDRANTAENVEYLTKNEREVILLCNLARLDGVKFSKIVVEPYLKGVSDSYVTSLYQDLKKVKELKMLVPDKQLTKAAEFHARDMGSAGLTGHVSSDGTDFSNRINRWCRDYSCIGENCDYGYDEAIDIVIHLLVDEGIENLGHRKNILLPEFDRIGVSIQSHSVYRFNCVQDFAH